MNISADFKDQSIYRIRESHKRIIACMDMLDESQIWLKPNTALNSMGNLVLHLCGNITQYIISTLGGAPDHRNRDAEFAAVGGKSKEELKSAFNTVIEQSIQCIKNVGDADLSTIKKVQVYDLTGVGIIIHVTEHLSYHTGQIAFLTKLLLERDLGFYAGLNLNQKHQ
ncbi:MAG: DinB family protein [Bacteroidota bacterium]